MYKRFASSSEHSPPRTEGFAGPDLWQFTAWSTRIEVATAWDRAGRRRNARRGSVNFVVITDIDRHDLRFRDQHLEGDPAAQID